MIVASPQPTVRLSLVNSRVIGPGHYDKLPKFNISRPPPPTADLSNMLNSSSNSTSTLNVRQQISLPASFVDTSQGGKPIKIPSSTVEEESVWSVQIVQSKPPIPLQPARSTVKPKFFSVVKNIVFGRAPRENYPKMDDDREDESPNTIASWMLPNKPAAGANRWQRAPGTAPRPN